MIIINFDKFHVIKLDNQISKIDKSSSVDYLYYSIDFEKNRLSFKVDLQRVLFLTNRL